ncbi:MAG: S-layer protein [Candidatus Diapherotrites archaeon]
MKSLNIKKLAAIAAGLALTGMAVAPIVTAAASDITKSDLVNTDGTPSVDIVVGKKAKASDIVWAGNIAAALAQKAYTDSTVSTTVSGGGTVPNVEGLTVDLTVGGTVTVSGGKTFYNIMYSGTSGTLQEPNFSNQLVTNANIPSLKYYGNKSYSWNAVSYSTTMQERLAFTADVLFEPSGSYKGLQSKIQSNGLRYNLNLGSGIPKCEGTGLPTCLAFADDSNDNIRIPFFGEDYLVKTVDYTNNYVQLLKAAAEKTYSPGDKIADLLGKDGGKYYVEVGTGRSVSGVTKIELTLYKEDGTKVASDRFSTGDVVFYDDSGNVVLATLLNISEIGTTTGTDGATVYFPVILTGSDRLLIYNAKGYPYDSTKTDDSYDWFAALTWGTGSDVNKLLDINVYNTSQNIYTGSKALSPGKEASFPNNWGSVKFLGLQLPEFSTNGVSKTERTTGITVGGGNVIYRDSTYEAEHTLPFYKRFTDLSNDSVTAGLTIDGKTIYSKINFNDVNIQGSSTADGSTGRFECIGDGNYVNGILVKMTFTTDQNTPATFWTTNDGPISDVNVGEIVRVADQVFKVSGKAPTAPEKCIYLTADGNVTFRKDSSTGSLIQYWYYADANLSNDNNAGNDRTANTDPAIGFEGLSSVTHYYRVMVDETSANSAGTLWLLLDGMRAYTGQYSKSWQLVGTDFVEGRAFGASDSNYAWRGVYVPHDTYMPAYLEGDVNYSSQEFLVANFRIDEDEDGVYDMNVFIATETGDLVQPTACNTNISSYTYEADWNGALSNKWMSACASLTYPSDIFTDFGTHAKEEASTSYKKYVAVVPENRPQAEILVAGTGTTEVTTGGESFTGKAKGDTVTTTSGTTVTIDDIKYSNATCTGEGGAALCTATPSTYKAMASIPTDFVKLDSDAGTGAHVIIGGWKVNTLAADIVGIQDKLAKKGDYIVEKDGDNVVVAGYTAADTMTAAQALITQIETFS